MKKRSKHEKSDQDVISIGRVSTEGNRAQKGTDRDVHQLVGRSGYVSEGVSLIQDGKFLFVNHSFASMHGYSGADELTGKQAVESVPREFRSSYMQVYESLVSGSAKEKVFQTKHVSKSGGEFRVEEKFNIINLSGRKIVFSTVTHAAVEASSDISSIENVDHLRKAYVRLKYNQKDLSRFGDIIGKSRPMQEIYDFILEAASSDGGVVIYGESGTGKELIAKTIHTLSDRHEMAFVPVNCGAIQASLFESEFFGHRKGAYTGADSDKEGFFDLANHGTLFLDEVGELTPNMQVKLLRALDGGGYIPVGDNKTRYSDVRIIAATNENLRYQIKAGKIREDFFFRIHIIPVYVPPLRDRKEDIPLLVENFLTIFSKGEKVPDISNDIMQILLGYNWPGNVRELQNVLQRYIATEHLDLMETIGHQEELGQTRHYSSPGKPNPLTEKYAERIIGLRSALKEYEVQLIKKALDQAHWNRKEASNILGIPLRTLSRKMQQYRLV